jgi:alpha/beta superfamily hydrolase
LIAAMPSRKEKAVTLRDGTSSFVADLKSRLAVVVTHPWGPLGGNMHNNVVVAVVLYFQRLGITTLRFDFAGSQIGRGYAQVQQLQDVAKSLVNGEFCDDKDNSEPTKPTHILLVGYSYGSLIVGSASAGIPNCIATVSIAPPFGVRHWLLAFNADHHLQQAAANETLPRLFVIGSHDNFTSEANFKRIVEDHFPAATGAVLKDADHFFARRERDVMDVVGEWLLRAFPQCHGDLVKLRDVDFGVVL